MNCYIANCRSPLRVNAKSNTTVEVINTTLDGGRYANIDHRNGTLILDNVTTIGLPKEGVVGLGIVVCQDANSNASVVINNKLNQYNWVSQNNRDLFSGNLQSYFDLIFSKELSYLKLPPPLRGYSLYKQRESLLQVPSLFIEEVSRSDGGVDSLRQYS